MSVTHVPFTVDWAGRSWRIDLTLWLHDAHLNVTRWHEDLRERITGDQRSAVLRIKDAWHRRPAYPDQVGGLDIYTAVLDDGSAPPASSLPGLPAAGCPIHSSTRPHEQRQMRTFPGHDGLDKHAGHPHHRAVDA